MRLFVAIDSPDEEGEFSYTVPGELVHFPPVVCDCPDCDCDTAMAGFVSHKATTNFMTRDLDLDAGAYTELLFETLSESGWIDDSIGDRKWVQEWAIEHMESAASLPPETPLRLRRGVVLARAAS